MRRYWKESWFLAGYFISLLSIELLGTLSVYWIISDTSADLIIRSIGLGLLLSRRILLLQLKAGSGFTVWIFFALQCLIGVLICSLALLGDTAKLIETEAGRTTYLSLTGFRSYGSGVWLLPRFRLLISYLLVSKCLIYEFTIAYLSFLGVRAFWEMGEFWNILDTCVGMVYALGLA